MAAPTRISYTETAWNTGGASKTTSSVSWLTGDVLVVVAICEDAANANKIPAVPTATGLTFTSQKVTGTGSFCAGRISAAVAGGDGSSIITGTKADGSPVWGFGVYVYRGSQGIGNSATQNTTTKTVALTPIAANCAVVWGVGDWSAEAAHSGTPTPTTTEEASAQTGYTPHVFDLTDQTSGGATSYGVTGGGSTGPYAILVLEVQTGAAGGSTPTPAQGVQVMTGLGTSLGFAINMPDEP